MLRSLWPWPWSPDLGVSHVEHVLCTSSRCGEHLSEVSSKSFKGLKSYRADRIFNVKVTVTLTLEPAMRNMRSARRLDVVNICLKFHQNPSKGWRVTERTGFSMLRSLWPWPWSQPCGTCALHVVLMWWTFVWSFIKILQRVKELQSGHDFVWRPPARLSTHPPIRPPYPNLITRLFKIENLVKNTSVPSKWI